MPQEQNKIITSSSEQPSLLVHQEVPQSSGAETVIHRTEEISVGEASQGIGRRMTFDAKKMSTATSTNFLWQLQLLKKTLTPKELAESFPPFEAASMLRYVRKNQDILILSQEKIHANYYLQELMGQLVDQHRAFISDESLSRNMADFFSSFQCQINDTNITINDLFIHAFGRGLISQDACYEGLIGYAFCQEFSSNQAAIFHSSSRIHFKKALEIKPQDGLVIQQRIFDKNGDFSPKGRIFIDELSKNLVEMNYSLGNADILGKFHHQFAHVQEQRKNVMAEQITQRILSLPEEARFFYEVTCTPKNTYVDFQIYWQKLMVNNEITPLIVVNSSLSHSDTFNFQLSSYHVLMEICRAVNFTGQEVDMVKPEICLGLVGDKTHTNRLLQKNSHISSYLDVRAKNNLVMVHNFFAGPAIALIHDLYFHLLIENKMAPKVRKLVLQDLPSYMYFILERTPDQNREIKPFLNELAQDFANIDYYYIAKFDTEMDQALYILRMRVGNSENRTGGPRFENASRIILNPETVAEFVRMQSTDMVFFESVMDKAHSS